MDDEDRLPPSWAAEERRRLARRIMRNVILVTVLSFVLGLTARPVWEGMIHGT